MDRFRIDVCNIRGLRANLLALYTHTYVHQPHIIAVNETKVCQVADQPEFHLPGYCLLPIFFPHRGLALFTRSDFAYQGQQQFNIHNPEFTAQWVKIKITKHILHFWFLY